MHTEMTPLMRGAVDDATRRLAGDDRDRHRRPHGVPQAADRRGRPRPDVVVTLGCGDACPIFLGKRYEGWGVADPAGQPIEVVRRIRYDVDRHVAELLETLPGAFAQ